MLIHRLGSVLFVCVAAGTVVRPAPAQGAEQPAFADVLRQLIAAAPDRFSAVRGKEWAYESATDGMDYSLDLPVAPAVGRCFVHVPENSASAAYASCPVGNSDQHYERVIERVRAALDSSWSFGTQDQNAPDDRYFVRGRRFEAMSRAVPTRVVVELSESAGDRKISVALKVQEKRDSFSPW